MAQKAAKSTAKRNAEQLKRTHLIALAVHGFYLVLRSLVFRRSYTRSSFLEYLILSAPSLVIEYVFERNSRPTYVGNELRSSGEDLEAKGLTEWMWDILYWTWACIALAALVGDRAWWLYIAVPFYSAYLAYTTFGNVRQMFGAPNVDTGVDANTSAGSRRQQKLEKRGQKVQYR